LAIRKRAYACVYSGIRFTYPERLAKKVGQPSLLFIPSRDARNKDEKGHVVLEVSEDNFGKAAKEVQEFIESHKAFQSGIVYRVATKEEREARKKAEKQKEALVIYRKVFSRAKPNFEAMTEKELIGLADEVGFPLNGKPASPKKLAQSIEKFILEEPEQ